MVKRKASDDFVVDDDEEETRPAQRTKTDKVSSHFASLGAAQTDDNGDSYWEISKNRRVVISEFKGKKMVNIREYYEKDGKSLPGKKGISMTLDQYSALVEILPQVEATLSKYGAKVPRPNYEGAKTVAKGEDSNGDGHGSLKKSNIDTTSDEDEEE